MIDWMIFWDDLVFWTQWGTTLVAGVLVLIACLGYFMGNRRLLLECVLALAIMGIVGGILANYGINIFAFDQIFAFFKQWF